MKIQKSFLVITTFTMLMSISAINASELTAEELAMPLNTPISEVGKGKQEKTASDSETSSKVRELEWDDLMPADYRIEELLAQMNAGEIADDDPRVDEALQKIKELFSKAPVVEDLHEQMVKLPGFVVPLDPNQDSMQDFLLVPYYGACIHVPPPPANQTVFVTGKPSKYKLYDTVWVKGKMIVERISNDLGDSGYSIMATEITPYE